MKIIEMFILSQIIVIYLLKFSNCLIHIFFNLWILSNKYFILGIICYFINVNFKARIIFLGLKYLFNFYSSENIAKLFILIFNIYKL